MLVNTDFNGYCGILFVITCIKSASACTVEPHYKKLNYDESFVIQSLGLVYKIVQLLDLLWEILDTILLKF